MARSSAILITDDSKKYASEVAKLGAEILAAVAGVALSHQSSSAHTSPEVNEILEENPGHILPVLVFPAEKLAVRGTRAIFRTLARIAPEQSFLGYSFEEQTLADEWFEVSFEFGSSIIPYLFASKASQAGEATRKARDTVLGYAHVINNRLLHSTFLASPAHPSVADVALYVVLFNSLTKSSALSELTQSRDLPHLGRWIEHVTHSALFSSPKLAAPSSSRPSSSPLPSSSSSSAAAKSSAKPSAKPSTAVPTRQAEPGIVWLGSAQHKIAAQPTTPLFTDSILPRLLNENVDSNTSGIIKLQTTQYAAKLSSSSSNSNSTQGGSGGDWNKLGFIHQPFPDSLAFVVEAPVPDVALPF